MISMLRWNQTMYLLLIASVVALSPGHLVTLSGSAAEPKGIEIDKDKKRVIIDAKIAPRKLADEKFQGKIYPIEVIACWSYPKGQKAHETLVTIDGIKPSDVHKA